MPRLTTYTVIGLTGCLSVGIAGPPAVAAPAPVWTVQASANPTTDPNNNPDLDGVSVASSAGWAVGGWTSTTPRGQSLIERLTASGWVNQSVGLLAGDNQLDGVATISKNNA